MGLEFLTRVRRSSLVARRDRGPGGAPPTPALPAGVALAAGVAWSLVNLYLLERLIVTHHRPASAGHAAARARAGLRILGGFLLLFAAGWLLLTRFAGRAARWRASRSRTR